MRPSNQLGQRNAGDVRGAGAVAEGWELYQSRSHGRARAVVTLANTHRLRERIERARNANLNS